MKIWRAGIAVGIFALATLAGASEGPLPAGAAQSAPATPVPNALTDNVALHFVGTLWAGVPVDVTLKGVGPTFNASLINQPDANPLIMTIAATVQRTTGGYLAELNFGQNVPQQATGDSNQVTVNYRNISTRVSVLLKPGQPAVVLEGNGQKVAVTLTTIPASAPVASTKLPTLGADGALDENLKISVKGTLFDGQPLDYSAITANNTFKASISMPGAVVTPTGSMSALANVFLKFAPSPGGGYLVHFTFGENLPVVLQASTSPDGRSSTSSITTRNISCDGVVVVPSLDQPIEVISSGVTKLVLTISHPPAK
jgi:hypothetical protein